MAVSSADGACARAGPAPATSATRARETTMRGMVRRPSARRAAMAVLPRYQSAKRGYCFASGFQFINSVIGAAASSSTVLIRNRPSRVTS